MLACTCPACGGAPPSRGPRPSPPGGTCRSGCTSFVSPASWPRSARQTCVLRSNTSQLLEASGIALSEAGVAKLHQRAEGWAAGLRLAAISLASSPHPERFVPHFSGTTPPVAAHLLPELLQF